MDIGALFNEFFLRPIINLLLGIYYLLQSANIPGALGFAILLLTLLIRLVVWPFTSSQLRSVKKMTELKPHLDMLKGKHKDDKQALAQAQMQLYKDHGVNPAGGCLPAIIQIPIFIALYQAINNVFPASSGGSLEYLNLLLYFPWMHLNTLPNPSFLGLNLASKPADFMSQGILLLMVPIITGALTLIQSLMSLPKEPLKIYPGDTPKETKEKEGVEESLAEVQKQMVYLMPIMVGVFAYQFPVGLAFYWNMYTIVGIVQQYRISGWGGLAKWIPKRS